MLMRLQWKRASALVLVLLVGCSSIPRVPHVEETSQGIAVVHVPRAAELQLVVLDKEEFQKAIRQLAREARLSGSPRQTAEKMFQMDPQFGNYLWLERDQKLVPLGPGEPLEGALTQEQLETAEEYRLWCQRVHHFYGDCLGGALVGGRYLDMHGRYTWALALSKSPVLDEMKKALGEMVEVRALINTVLWTLGSMLLIMALNPVAPALVAVVGVGLILYVGYDTLRNLVRGWLELMEEVEVATTFEQLREAGERFGKILGREAARAFAMLLMAAMGRTAHEFAARVPTLPGSAQAAVQSEGAAGIPLSSLGAVEEMVLTAEGVSIRLPSNAVAMARQGRGSRMERHHIATIANKRSAKRGGPWTPLFEKLFARAGMRLKDAENIVPIQGHRGPHPQRYHELVFERLEKALGDCHTVAECRARLLPALKDLAKQIATPGTELNRLVTLGE